MSKKAKILIDCGTSYTKIYLLDSKKYEIIPTKDIKRYLKGKTVISATGHNARRFASKNMNELIALAKGAQKHLSGKHETIIDCGSRDIKYLTWDKEKGVTIDWNTECGAFCGQVVELLTNFFQFDTDLIAPADKPIPLTCGILGMTRMFDLIAEDISPDKAFARFIKGLANNIYQFVGKPKKIYLSGGLCENKLFLKSFSKTDVIPLGRFVLLDGLRENLSPHPHKTD